MKKLIIIVITLLSISSYSQECPDKFFIKGFIGCHSNDIEFVIKKTELDYNYNKQLDFEYDDSLICIQSTLTVDHNGFVLMIIHALDEHYTKVNDYLWYDPITNISVAFSKGRREGTFIYIQE